VSELTESNFNTDNRQEFWQNCLTTYKLIALLAEDLLSAPASQSFVERIFSLCGLLSSGRRNRMLKSMGMRAFLQLNKQMF
jgi:c-di-GMP-related signal transduction protein